MICVCDTCEVRCAVYKTNLIGQRCGLIKAILFFNFNHTEAKLILRSAIVMSSTFLLVGRVELVGEN